ncbi:hypothetical protein K502DRAFT_352030 [Neoconidiobolus thromboides FSU 785]|nr:hypothetical protein K502DRAFT_352030 [Neoconidiobolus thromboides FSU 785]
MQFKFLFIAFFATIFAMPTPDGTGDGIKAEVADKAAAQAAGKTATVATTQADSAPKSAKITLNYIINMQFKLLIAAFFATTFAIPTPNGIADLINPLNTAKTTVEAGDTLAKESKSEVDDVEGKAKDKAIDGVNTVPRRVKEVAPGVQNIPGL